MNWWYAYGVAAVGTPGVEVAQISVAAPLIPVATLQSEAQQNPGGYWIIGNEPNVPGEDNASPDFYASQLQYYVNAIKGADPTAQIVGPNALNWDDTCTGCTGFTSGHSWVDSFRSSWATQYGGEPPIDVWSLHAYPITWDSLPMTNTSLVEDQISGFSTYLAGIPADQAKPIWLTEVGVIWGFDNFQWLTTGCALAPNCIDPVGPYDTAAVTSYLTTLLSWFTANSTTFRLDRWFLYSTIGAPESYETTYGGISLLSGSSNTTLTSFGQLYQQYAQSQ